MKRLLIENLIKNVIIILILIGSYFPIKEMINNSTLAIDKSSVGDLLLVISIVIVTACFGNFAFSYEKLKLGKEPFLQFTAHLTSGLLMLIIGLSLEITAVLTSLLFNNFWTLNIILLLLYISSVTYDFLDLHRIKI
jgi:hypothetical protein